MSDERWLVEQFDARRARLRAVALRMLGSESESDDAVQEAWLKLRRADAGEVQNLGGWLTTIVARVCLDMLRARKARREAPLAPSRDPADVELGPVSDVDSRPEPAVEPAERDIVLAEAIGPALLVVLDTLAPAERVAFVLHDLFDLPFEEIGPILERSPAATRQLASRARRRVRGAPTPSEDAHGHELVGAFLAASRDGDFERLLAVLSPDVVLRADELAVRSAAARATRGAPRLVPESRGASEVAGVFAGRARGAVAARINGAPGAAWAMGDEVRAAFRFTLDRGAITAIAIVMDPAALHELVIELL